jgi:hypothetical protein
MKEIQKNSREQILRVVNDIIYMAHRIRVPSKRVKDLFVDQILRLDSLKQYFDIREKLESNLEDGGDQIAPDFED